MSAQGGTSSWLRSFCLKVLSNKTLGKRKSCVSLYTAEQGLHLPFCVGDTPAWCSEVGSEGKWAVWLLYLVDVSVRFLCNLMEIIFLFYFEWEKSYFKTHLCEVPCRFFWTMKQWFILAGKTKQPKNTLWHLVVINRKEHRGLFLKFSIWRHFLDPMSNC